MIVKINNGEPLFCTEGSILTRNYNETLDSANIRIAHLSQMLEIEPFDDVQIYFGNTVTVIPDLYMLVDSFECIEEGLDNVHYTYEINLFSVTKKLENIVLPNITITPLKNNPRPIAYYLEQYLREYGDVHWNLSQGSEMSIFNDTVCPEMQWNAPTLREVFDDLMMVVDRICVFEGTSVISCYDLTKKGEQITDYNYIRRSRSSQDYVSEIRMNLQNAMEDDSTIKTEIVTYTANSGWVLTSENIIVKTQFPIKNINHCWVNFVYFNATLNKYQHIKADIMTLLDGPLIQEDYAYQLLETLYIKQVSQIPIDDNIYKYQNFCLHYQRFSNVITGFSDTVSNLFSTRNKIQIILAEIFKKTINSSSSIDFSQDSLYYNSVFFEIEYETSADLVFSATKMCETKHKRTIVDNQTNSFVNTKVQSNLEYQKANRLGNEQMMINQRANSINNAIKLAQVYDDSIVYQVQYQIYSDHVEVNALATKDYVLKNYFTGIKSHIRTWINAKDEALVRHELLKERYVITYQTPSEISPYDRFLTVPLLGGQGSKLNYCIFTPKGVTGAKTFYIECISRVLSNSMVFTFGCDDNATVYTYYDSDKIQSINIAKTDFMYLKTEFIDDYGGVPLKSYKYVDDVYENTGITFYLVHSDGKFFRNLETTSVSTSTYQIFEAADTVTNNYFLDFYVSPLLGSLDTISMQNILSGETNFHKDNKEISKYSFQVEFGVDDIKNLFLSQLFVERQKYIVNGMIPAPNTFYKSKTLSASLPNDAQAISVTVSLPLSYNIIQISFSENAVNLGEVIYICFNDKIILAARYIEESFHTIENGTVNMMLYLIEKE